MIFGPGKLRKRSLKVLEKSWNSFGLMVYEPCYQDHQNELGLRTNRLEILVRCLSCISEEFLTVGDLSKIVNLGQNAEFTHKAHNLPPWIIYTLSPQDSCCWYLEGTFYNILLIVFRNINHFAYHEFHETCHFITFYFLKKKDSKRCCDTTMPESIHNKDESKRGCASLWCELTVALWCHSIVWSLFSWFQM